MANEQQKTPNNLFTTLRRLFSSDVIIRNEGGGQLKVVDTDHIQSNGVLQTNSLVDRFHKVYTTSTAYGVNLNLAQNYRSARVQIYADYDAMDTDAIIASALDIIADECTLKNEQGEVLQIRSSDENIQRLLYNLFYSTLNVEFNLWGWIRNMCKYGDFYLKIEISEKYGVYNVIPFSAYNIAREEGYNPRNPNEVRFKFDPNAAIASTSGYSAISREDETGIYFDNYEMAHFRLTGDVNYLPYGRSYLEPARKLFKQYVLIEDAMLIHRIVRAPEKRVFYVNIGAIPPNEVENFMQRMINKMKKTPLIDPSTGQYNLKYNMQNMLEDIYIPVRGNDATTRIDTAKGLDYNGIEDVQYFREKLFAALKIPKAFMGYEKDLTGKATLAAEDIRFARTIERIQRIITSELTKIALIHLYSNGYQNESATNFSISLTNPSIIYDQERIALFKEKIDLANQAMESKLLPRDFIYNKIFQFSEDQYSEMDDMIIEDQKRTFRYNQIVEEGNDPAETGQAFGTPHQLASLYGGKAQTSLDVPTGYDEKNPNEPIKLPGRPQKYKSIIGTDESPFGRDALGKKGMKSDTRGGENSMGYSFQGGSPLALENTMMEFLRMKSSLEKMPHNAKNVGRKTTLFEESDLSGRKTDLFAQPEMLNESAIMEDNDFPEVNRIEKPRVAVEPEAKEIITENEEKKEALKIESIVPTPEPEMFNENNLLDDQELVVLEHIESAIESNIEKLSEYEADYQDLKNKAKTIAKIEERIKEIEDERATTLLNEDGIIGDDVIKDLEIEKTVIPETLFDESKILNEDAINLIQNVEPNSILPVTLLDETQIASDKVIDDITESIMENTSVLEPTNILREDKLEEISKIVETYKENNKEEPKILDESNILDHKPLDALSEAITKVVEDNNKDTKILDDENILNEDALNRVEEVVNTSIEQKEKTTTLLEDSNIVNESILEKITEDIEKKQSDENATLNLEQNIVNENLFNEVDSTIADKIDKDANIANESNIKNDSEFEVKKEKKPRKSRKKDKE